MIAVAGKVCRSCGVFHANRVAAFHPNRGSCKECVRASNNARKAARGHLYNATRRLQWETRRAVPACVRCGQPTQRKRTDAKYCASCLEGSQPALRRSRSEMRQAANTCQRCGKPAQRKKVAKHCASCYKAANHESKMAYTHRIRAMEYGAPGSHTRDEFLTLCEAEGWACRYCSRSLNAKTVTQDHVVPLSRGGGDGIDNIVPACLSCNSRKGDKTAEEFCRRVCA